MADIETKIIEEIRRNLVTALVIIDDEGKMNPELNGRMLWLKGWDRLRECLVNNVALCDEFRGLGQ